MTTSLHNSLGIIGIACALAASPASASVLISNFEPTTYTSDQTFIGVDDWTNPFGGSPPEFLVTPSATSGYNFVIAGTQSAVVQSTGYAYKSFASAGVTAGDLQGVSWLQGGAGTLGDGYLQGMFLANTSGSTPFGIFGRNVGGTVNIWVFGGIGGSFFDTGISYVTGGGASALDQVYEFSMEFDFTNSEMTAYYRDVTAGGSRTALLGSPLDFDPLLTASTLAGDYGVLLRNNNVFAAGYDNIATIPEPSTNILIALGGVLAVILCRKSRLRVEA